MTVLYVQECCCAETDNASAWMEDMQSKLHFRSCTNPAKQFSLNFRALVSMCYAMSTVAVLEATTCLKQMVHYRERKTIGKLYDHPGRMSNVDSLDSEPLIQQCLCSHEAVAQNATYWKYPLQSFTVELLY